MPRVPISQGAPPVGRADINIYAFEPIRRGLQGLGNSLQRIGYQADRNALLQARTKILEAVNEGQIAAEGETDPEKMLERYDEIVGRVQSEVEEELGGRLKSDLAPFTAEAVGSRRFGLIREQAARREQVGIARLDENLAETLRSIDQTPEGVDGLRLRETALGLIESSALDPVRKNELRQRFEREIDLQAARRMLVGDPAMAARLAADPEAFFQSFPELNPSDRFVVADSARVELNRRETEGREARARAQEAAVNGWLNKVFGPIDELPTIPEVLADPVLPPTAKEHFIALVEKRSKGDEFKTNESVYTDLYMRIHDEVRPDHITSFTEVLPYIGKDLTPARAEELRLDIDQLSGDPGAKERDKRLTEYLRISKVGFSSLTPAGFPIVDRSYGNFVYEARRRWKEVEASGRDPIQVLLDPKSSESLDRLADQMKPTWEDTMQLMRQLTVELQKKAEPRREGESMEDYDKRVGAP